MKFEHHNKELVDKYQIGTTLVYIIGESFCTVVTVTSNGSKCQTLTKEEALEYLDQLRKE